MKRLLFLSLILISWIPKVSGQNVMILDEYEICSDTLNAIIDHVLTDVEEGEYISVMVCLDKDNNREICFSAESLKRLAYNSRETGYTKKGNTIILFSTSVKDMVCKKSANNNRLTLYCTDYGPILDGCKEWVFLLKEGKVFIKRKNLAW